MKRLIILLFVFSKAYAQEPTYVPMKSNYLYRGIKMDTLFIPPAYADTSTATTKVNFAGSVVRVGSKLWMRNSALTQWVDLSSQGSVLDTTSLSNRINSKADSSIGLNKVLQNGNIAYNLIDLYDTINNKVYEIYLDPSAGDNALIGMLDTLNRLIILETNGANNRPSISFVDKNRTQYLSKQDSSAGTLLMPYQDLGAVDTIATLKFVRDSAGGNLTLNQVTDFGNTTQNNIIFVDDADLQMDTFSSVLLANNSRLQEGTIDAGYGGNKGIAQICGLGYELKWEGGMLFSMGSSGNTIREARYMFNYIPQDTNDITEGYYVGSRWILDNGDTYECTDNTIGAAVWVLQPNAFDSTSLSNRIDNKVDSVTKSTDSVRYWKNGSSYFAYKDASGGQNGRWGNDTATIILAKVHNSTATTLTRGTVVMLNGATGDVASVIRANNKYDSTSARTIGLVKDPILAGDTGWVVTQGQASKLNLGAYNEGDVLYLDSLDGGLTKTKPVAPYHGVFVCIVERANAGNGLAYVKPQNGQELGEIHDVRITNPINNQVLVYSDTQDIWKNRNIYSVIDTASMLSPYLRKADTSSLSNRINAKENALTFSTGLTRATNTITSNLSTGVSGGQALNGGTAASDSLRLFSTTNATKGFMYFGSSAYDENNNRLGINTRTPVMPLDVTFSSVNSMAATIAKTQTRLNSTDQGDGAMQVNYTLSGTGAGTELITRVFSLGSTNAWTSGTITNSRIFNLATNTNSSTTTTNLDAVFIENGTTSGAVTNYRGIVVNNSQGTSRAGLVVNSMAGTNRAYALLGTTAIPSGTWSVYSSNADKSYFNGNVLIGTTTDAGFKLDVNGTARANAFQLSALNVAPATAASAGTTGEIRIVNGFIYVCVATNTWQRATLSTW